MGGGGPVHVLHVRIVTGAGGGPEKTILNSPRHLEGTRYREAACYLHAPGDGGIEILRRRAQARGCPFLPIEDPHPYDLRTLAHLADVCRAGDVRIWHGHDYKSNFFGLLLRKLCDLRLVTTVHGWVKHTARTPVYFAVDRFALRRHEEVIAVSQDLFDECLRIGVPSQRLTLVENAIDTEEFRRTRPARESPLRAPASAWPEGRLLVGAVGRLSDEKGFDLLIQAVESAVDRGSDLVLWIAGEGDQEMNLRAQIAASPHADRMQLLGWRPDQVELHEAFDVFALSSIREGLPNVVLEAMAMEVPILATRAGGLAAFGRDGEDMLLVRPGSVDELADGLETLARDSALRSRLARSARRRVEETQSFVQRTQAVARVYDRLLADDR